MAILENFLLFLIPLIIICICFKFRLHSTTTKNVPPSPRKLPIIGNFHQLSSNPHRSLQALSRKHGPLMLLHLGSIPTLIVSSAEAAQHIMKTHDTSFSSRPSLTMPNILFYACKGISFSSYGENWRRLRSIVVVHLLSKIRVKSFKQIREEETSLMVQTLSEKCASSSVDLSALIVALANNIICRVALGRSYRGIKFTNSLRKLIDMVDVFSVGSYIPWLSWVDRISGLEGRAKTVAKEFDELLEDAVKEHEDMKKGRVYDENDEHQNLVDILLRIQKDDKLGFNLDRVTLKSVLLDMFAAGIDTTFTTLVWTMSEMIRNPRVMKKLQLEVIKTGQGRTMIMEEDLEELQYLKAVIKETLRLHPPIPIIPRQSTQDVKLMGYDIPAGTQVFVNVLAVGIDHTLWEEPMEFRPERFMENPTDYNGIRFDWLPFGGGRRGCPGIQFGVDVIELALANLVYKFDFTLPNGVKNEELDMSEKYGITIQRKSSLLVKASPRF